MATIGTFKPQRKINRVAWWKLDADVTDFGFRYVTFDYDS
jgi:hypothetical protein